MQHTIRCMANVLFNRVRVFLLHQQLFQRDQLILVAVSGGPDSLCLLHLLQQLRADGGPALHVAHLDHGFRGNQSAAEAHFVEQTARAWGLPATVAYEDVPALARAARRNKQAAARAARYAFLARVAQDTGAAAVAVAHQADDQAETVLLHLLRGAGPTGLRGMRAVAPWEEWSSAEGLAAGDCMSAQSTTSPPLIRPLLTTTRAEIEAYCAEHALTPQHDPSNYAAHYARSRLRADLLPYLAGYNPQIIAALGRTAQICADDYVYMQTQLDAYWPALAEEQPGRISLRSDTWAELPIALQRYALRRAALRLIGSDSLSYDQIEAGRAVIATKSSDRFVLGADLIVQIGYETVHIERTSNMLSTPGQPLATTALPQLPCRELPLAAPGEVTLSSFWRAEAVLSQPTLNSGSQRWWVALDADALDGPLLLRCRRPGDRFRPAGGRGSRLIQDFFVDQKLPRELRAAWPLLATPTSIVWVAGLCADERFQVTDRTQHSIWVGLTQTGEHR